MEFKEFGLLIYDKASELSVAEHKSHRETFSLILEYLDAVIQLDEAKAEYATLIKKQAELLKEQGDLIRQLIVLRAEQQGRGTG